MGYFLKLYDRPLLKFEVLENLADPVLRIDWIDEQCKNLLPIGMTVSEEGLSRWLTHRSIPKNRAYVHSFLSKCGLNANRPMDIISICRGLSLNDAYWVTEDTFDETFDKYNLYENNLSRILGLIAFTGYGSSVRSTFASSPEFTTNGMLPKCWRRSNGKVMLYKGGTSGASNAGMEPYSELYASIIGQAAGFNVIPYRLAKWKGQLCSVCDLFTDKDTSYVPVGRIIKAGGMRAVRQFYEELGQKFVDALNEMIVFDAIICNTDRHFGNFGVLIDSHTNKIIAPAPLFDHGNSLFNFAGSENWETEELLQAYIDTLLPQTYEDFIDEARKYIDDRLKERMRHLLSFTLVSSGRYNYPAKQRHMIEQQVRKRARLILD